jgi:uncharacterized phiE125 gp8 family phage protein
MQSAILDYSIEATSAAAFEAVSLAEAKAQCRVLHDSDDTLLSRLISAAREQVEKDAGLAIAERTYRQTIDQFPCDDFIELKRRPVQSVESVKYQDGDDAEQTFSTSAYSLDTGRAAVLLDYDASWPATRAGRNAVTVEFTAGYADADSVPELANHAILMLLAHWYAVPEAEVLGVSTEIKQGYERIIRLLMRGHYP